ncbi:MAG TPA: sigma factor, partial [Candidatus Limnocylindrales bacterium]
MTVEALRRRRPSTLADLLEAYGRELQAVAYLILRDRAEAEDVVIETLLTAFERGGDIRDERALRAWLLRVATNHALGRRRRTARLVRLDLSAQAAGPGDL